MFQSHKTWHNVDGHFEGEKGTIGRARISRREGRQDQCSVVPRAGPRDDIIGVLGDMESEDDGIAFQEDGAPSHKAKTTLKWLNDHNIDIFPYPSSLPNLNPIECVWCQLKKGIKLGLIILHLYIT
ncbi:hypothetical protein BT96DRAFT_816026 [Gymnopus androsaceus JB14]|uniref:Tc1-like transposase DDE domain-containing protein n=1 Tax=Gymnopus androsaceus JB14 TaxID=1447944 RepID=A0A6A4HYD8_9AGAR|nr:hypothetical protein BT96DRAFT_816026 [Gymnopus androsaceus JB14]